MKKDLNKTETESKIILYKIDEIEITVDVRYEDETFWLTQKSMAELFDVESHTITYHLQEIYKSEELEETATTRKIRAVQREGTRDVERERQFYNLDAIIAVGYRVNSKKATKFRQWATKTLKEYIIKGFVIDSDKLKDLGGNYWKELLDKIRDIRSSENILYRQVLDLYATAVDYDPKDEKSIKFFKIVQNKLHYAAHGHTASEVIYLRVDSDKPFVGLQSFKGPQPNQAELMDAKNYLLLSELEILNKLVFAYFDIAEINAIEKKPMYMQDYISELDHILKSTNRKLLNNARKVSKKEAENKAIAEYTKYTAKTLSEVEKAYLESIKEVKKKLKEPKK